MADSLPSCPVRLEEARSALHRLQTSGGMVETWTRSGLRTKYSQVNLADLRNYVRELEAECGGPDGGPQIAAQRRRPFGIFQ